MEKEGEISTARTDGAISLRFWADVNEAGVSEKSMELASYPIDFRQTNHKPHRKCSVVPAHTLRWKSTNTGLLQTEEEVKIDTRTHPQRSAPNSEPRTPMQK